MADQVIWSLEALDDVEEIAKFIERDYRFRNGYLPYAAV